MFYIIGLYIQHEQHMSPVSPINILLNMGPSSIPNHAAQKLRRQTCPTRTPEWIQNKDPTFGPEE